MEYVWCTSHHILITVTVQWVAELCVRGGADEWQQRIGDCHYLWWDRCLHVVSAVWRLDYGLPRWTWGCGPVSGVSCLWSMLSVISVTAVVFLYPPAAVTRIRMGKHGSEDPAQSPACRACHT